MYIQILVRSGSQKKLTYGILLHISVYLICTINSFEKNVSVSLRISDGLDEHLGYSLIL